MAGVKVLVVDDSAFMRKVISDLINQGPDMEVIGTARDGNDALIKIKELNPDVVTMDVEMPYMDGLSALEKIMREHPLPVIMLSSVTKTGADQTLRALQLGAVDFIAKPSGSISLDIDKVKNEILGKIRVAAGARKKLQNLNIVSEPGKVISNTQNKLPRTFFDLQQLVLIGTSTGGPKALYQVIPRLPADTKAGVLVVQHMPPGFTRSLAERLDALSQIHVKEAEQGEKVLPGTVYIAPGDYHLKVRAQKGMGKPALFVELDQSPPRGGLRPAVDVMFESAAREFWANIICVIMTGMGHDGSAALPLLKQRGARIIAEDQSTCIVYGMPKAAVETGLVDKVSPLTNIHSEILKYI
jgi:two-component system chemotaxis response regulator CheB